MIIGLSGKARIGKDTAGSYLEIAHGFTRVAFADHLKKLARKAGWDGRKDERGRRFLQEFGADVRRLNLDFWVDMAFVTMAKEEKLTGQTNFVITDLRYTNEAESIKEASGVVVRIWGEHENTSDLHASETELDSYTLWDSKIQSIRGDFTGFYKQLDELVENQRSRVTATQTA